MKPDLDSFPKSGLVRGAEHKGASSCRPLTVILSIIPYVPSPPPASAQYKSVFCSGVATSVP